jgi:hypothetical protein
MVWNRVWTRLHNVPRLAYLFLAMACLGGLVELSYHFLPPAVIPPYNFWLLGLSAVDRDFYFLVYELIAHVCIAVGLMGMVSVYVYQQMSESGAK